MCDAYLIPFHTSRPCWSCVSFNTLQTQNRSYYSQLIKSSMINEKSGSKYSLCGNTYDETLTWEPACPW